MRDACTNYYSVGWTDSDSEIAALLFATEGYPAAGYDRYEAQAEVDAQCLAACQSSAHLAECGLACLTCNYALLDTVY